METVQNATTEKDQTGIKPYKAGVFDDWLTWKALGGLMVDEEDGKYYKMSLTEFCQRFDIARSTANDWRKQTPNLAQLVEQRRNEIMPLAKVSAAYNQLFLLGMQSQDKRAAVEALKTFLGHFGNLQLPVQRQDIKHEGLSWADLATSKRQVVEATIVDADTSNSA